MNHIFIDLLNISITAGYLVLAVILLRPLLKKAPMFIRCILWGFVGLRLMFPFSVESIFSLIPSAETVPQEILYSSQPAIQSGIPFMNSVVNPILSESMAPTVGNSVNPMQVVMSVGSWIWVAGMVILLVYAGISYIRLRLKLREAVYEGENIWICDHIDSAFLLGLFRPRIFLPSALTGQDKEYVIAHERAHLRRKDHWWKPIGFLLLTVYCFNPLIWVAYILLCRDIEFACDEKVIRQLGTDCKKSYSEALINCSVSKKSISACPVAFGEEGVPGRIRSILNYKKPAFWIILIAAVLCIAVAVCFLTVPQKDVQLFGARYETGRCLFSAVVSADKETDSNNLVFDIHDNNPFFREAYKEYESGEREYLGDMLPLTYTEDELNGTLAKQGSSPISLKPIQDNYVLLDRSGTLDYVFFVHTDGSVTMVSFFSDESVMNIFELNKIDPCDHVNSTHNATVEAYVTHLDPENGYLIATVTAKDSDLFQKSVHIPSCPDDIAMGEKIHIIYDGIISATNQYPLSIQNPYYITSQLIYDYRFAGIVLETQDDAVLVEPAEGTDARQYADKFVVRSPNPDAFQAGDQVRVYYDLMEDLNPPIIPYPCTIKTNNSTELFNPSIASTTSQTVYDIDSDGIAEYCCVTELYERLHILAVYAYENGVLDYCEYFSGARATGFSFQVSEDGALSILSTDPKRIFTLSVQDSRLILTDEKGEQLIRLSERAADVATLQDVISKYPHFLNLPTPKGLEVYVWKNGDWRCGVRPATNRTASIEEFWAFGDGASLEEMAVILSSYDISKAHVYICYHYHPAFSGPYEVVPSAGEQAYIEATLLQHLVYKNFHPSVQYPLVIYAFDMAPNAWCFQFLKNTTIMHTPFDLMNYPHCNLETALEKLKDYDIDPGQIPVVVYQNPLSSYYGGPPEGKTQTVRQMLGLG